jgi:hypothetical protein
MFRAVVGVVLAIGMVAYAPLTLAETCTASGTACPTAGCTITCTGGCGAICARGKCYTWCAGGGKPIIEPDALRLSDVISVKLTDDDPIGFLYFLGDLSNEFDIEVEEESADVISMEVVNDETSDVIDAIAAAADLTVTIIVEDS